MNKSINTLLIANRGEVAARIQATAHHLGIKTVCVYAADDTAQAHLATAHAVYPLSEVGSSAYCNQEELITIAQNAGVDAIHPGYGFLSEVAPFAQRVIDAGLLFIGPTPKTIAHLGDKGCARILAEKVSIPVIPGKTFDHQQKQEAHLYADSISYPILLKATSGGGGRGMTAVYASDQFIASWHCVSAEGTHSVNTTDIVVEKLLPNARHIEVQIAGDGAEVIHLFERDCSVQRRRQKIVEEAPAYNLSEALRTELHEAAIRIGKAAHYVGIGTVEFLVANEQFYFLEINPRLQVEHGVTELITGRDLVALQLHIAEHKALPYHQDEITQRGSAIQCRLYTEDVTADFTPCTGTITAHYIPPHPFTHIQHSIEIPHPITGLYDAMISKALSWGTTRHEARMRLHTLLSTYRLAGITTNRSFLQHILTNPAYIAGTLHTQSITELLATYQPMSFDLTRLAAALSYAVPSPQDNKPTSGKQPRSYWKEKKWHREA